MTKSIKEKTRLRIIKEHQDFGYELLQDMIKVKLRYKYVCPLGGSYNLSSNFVKDHMQKLLKRHIYKCILPIAINLRIYEFKLSIQVCIYNNKEDKQTACLFLRLKDSKGKFIGYLHFKGEHIRHKLYADNEGNFHLSNKMMEIEHMKGIISSFEQQKENIQLSPSVSQKINSPHIKKLKADFIEHEFHYWHSKKILKKPLLEIVIDKEINFFIRSRFLSTSKQPERNLMLAESYNDITYINFLIENRMLELPIEKELINMENIEEIRKIVKLMNY